MASSTFDLAMHRLHVLLQKRRLAGLVAVVSAGVAIGSIVVGYSAYKGATHYGPARDATMQRASQVRSAINMLKAERVAQVAALERLERAPQEAHQASLQAGGFTEDDVNYWRKQMAAFSQMTGVRLAISGRGPSRYQNATRLSVSVSLAGSPIAGGLSAVDLVKALDFLQLYGYVESFNGSEAIVHITEAQHS